MYHSQLTNNRGQTIIEAAVALSVVVLTLSAITLAIITSVNNSQFIKDQSLSSKYAEQGMEYIKYMRNNDPVNFSTYAGVHCMNQDNSFLSTSCSVVNIPAAAPVYKREAEFSANDSQCAQDSTSGAYGTKVTVTVYFTSTKCPLSNTYCHSSSLISCFSTVPTSLKNL